MQKIQNPKVRLGLLALLILIQAAGLLLFPIGVKQMADVGFRQSGRRLPHGSNAIARQRTRGTACWT